MNTLNVSVDFGYVTFCIGIQSEYIICIITSWQIWAWNCKNVEKIGFWNVAAFLQCLQWHTCSGVFVYNFNLKILSLFPTRSLQGHSMPATEGPLPQLTPQLPGQKETPICTSSIHHSPFILQLAPASPSAPLMVSSGPTTPFRAPVELHPESARS